MELKTQVAESIGFCKLNVHLKKHLTFVEDYLACSVKAKTRRNLFAFQITINGLWTSNDPCFQFLTPENFREITNIHQRDL